MDEIIRAAIVEHEQISRSRIRELLGLHTDIQIVAEYANAARALTPLTEAGAEVLFLDAGCGAAFATLDKLKESRNVVTILVAAHNGFAMKAFEYGAIDYLIKPFDTDRFRVSVARARESVQRQRSASAVAIDEPRGTSEPIRRLAVKRRGKIVIVRMEDVDWIDAAGNYVRLHVGSTNYLHRHTLADFVKHLDRRNFVRIHRSAIVNIDRVAFLEPSFRDHVVVLQNGSRLKLSHAYRHDVEFCIGRF